MVETIVPTAQVKEGGVKDIMICFAKLIGNTMLEVLPPLSFLGQMQKMMEEQCKHWFCEARRGVPSMRSRYT